MASTDIFYGTTSTLTVHMPPGSAEAVLMIEALDNVASLTLPLDEVKRLIATLQDRADAPDPTGSPGLLDATNPSSIP